jgi:6-phosphogluconolactonase/glucosamine-6-phosphate isomerase/deaminase
LTITPQVITTAQAVFMLATGPAKAAMLCMALDSPNDIETMPARLALGGIWLMDHIPHRDNNPLIKK